MRRGNACKTTTMQAPTTSWRWPIAAKAWIRNGQRPGDTLVNELNAIGGAVQSWSGPSRSSEPQGARGWSAVKHPDQYPEVAYGKVYRTHHTVSSGIAGTPEVILRCAWKVWLWVAQPVPPCGSIPSLSRRCALDGAVIAGGRAGTPYPPLRPSVKTRQYLPTLTHV
jgi:hypothetical protein